MSSGWVVGQAQQRSGRIVRPVTIAVGGRRCGGPGDAVDALVLEWSAAWPGQHQSSGWSARYLPSPLGNPAVNSAFPTLVASDRTAARAATESASSQDTSSSPAVAPTASAPTPAITTAANVWSRVFRARSKAPFQNSVVVIMSVLRLVECVQ